MRVIGNASVAAAAQLQAAAGPGGGPRGTVPLDGRHRTAPGPAHRRGDGTGDRAPTDAPATGAPTGAAQSPPHPQGRSGAARRAGRADGLAASRPRSTGRSPCCGSRSCGRGRLRSPHHHPAPGLRRQPRHRQDDGGAAGGGIYRALGLLSKGQLVEVDRSELVAGYLGQTAIKTAEVVAVRGRRGAVHRRGVQPGRRPVRHRGGRHPGQGDGGPARRPGRDRGRLPRADGDLHRAKTRAGQPVPHHDRVRRLHRRRAGRRSSQAGRGRRLRVVPRPSDAVPRDPGRHPRGPRSATAGSPATCWRPRSAGTRGGFATSRPRPPTSCASCSPTTWTTTPSRTLPAPECRGGPRPEGTT